MYLHKDMNLLLGFGKERNLHLARIPEEPKASSKFDGVGVDSTIERKAISYLFCSDSS